MRCASTGSASDGPVLPAVMGHQDGRSRDTATRLVELLVRLIDMPCVTGDEDRIATWLVDRYTGRGAQGSVLEHVHRDGQAGLHVAGAAATHGVAVDAGGDVTVGGWYDVGVADEQHERARVVLWVHLGGVDDHGVRDPPYLRAGPMRLALVAYAGEEGALADNELEHVLTAAPELTGAALAIVLEPTDLDVQLGCMGGLHAEVAIPGHAAHSARPWQGRNALTAAAPLLAALDALEPNERTVDGLVWRDVVTATRAWTSNARNVVPDAFTVNINYRFSPARSLAEAETDLRAQIQRMAGTPVEVTIVDRAPPAPPLRGNPHVQALVRASGGRVAAKQAWTDVAQLVAAGVPALNYGPGLTGQAHQAGEYVPIDHLEQARTVLAGFLISPTLDPGQGAAHGA